MARVSYVLGPHQDHVSLEGKTINDVVIDLFSRFMKSVPLP